MSNLESSERIAVLGAGAIGGAMAAALGDAGHDVQLCVRTPFAQLNRELEGQTQQYGHRVFTEPSDMDAVDWLLICTKAHQLDAASGWLSRLIGPRTRVAVMQNGVDHIERVSQYVERDRILPCIILLPSSSTSPGHVKQAAKGVVQVPNEPLGHALRVLFADQDAVRIDAIDDFVTALWNKLILNAVGGAVCALALKPLSAMGSPHVRELVTALIEEVAAVGRAEGATIAQDCATRIIEYFKGPIGTHWTSMAADRRDGRRMEWQARNAVVGRIGRQHGINTPYNDAMTALLALCDET